MNFSLVGFFVGALCAIVLYVVGTELFEFARAGLIFGLAGLLLWGYLTLNWPGEELHTRRR